MPMGLSARHKINLLPQIERTQGSIEQHRTIRFTYIFPKGELACSIEAYYVVFHWYT